MKTWIAIVTISCLPALAFRAQAQREFANGPDTSESAIPIANQCAQLKSFRTLANGRRVLWNRCAEFDPLSSSKHPLKLPHDGTEVQYRIGTVILLATIESNGRLSDLHVEKSSGQRELDDAAHKAVAQWKFLPGYQSGIPKRSYVRIPIRFDTMD